MISQSRQDLYCWTTNIADENLSNLTQAEMFCNRATSSVFDMSSDVPPEVVATGNQMKLIVTLKVQCGQKYSKKVSAIINRMWRNNSFDIASEKYTYCLVEVAADVSMLTC